MKLTSDIGGIWQLGVQALRSPAHCVKAAMSG